MPRQRKPQSGVARAAGRVANTTTSLGWKDIWNTNPKVYRIPTWGMRTECPAPLSEVGWVYPVSVRREGNVFYVSLPEENLKSVIEGMSDLDLSNVTVTMDTINGPLTINGAVTVDWDIAWQAINWTDARFDSITATTWNITNVTSSSTTTSSLTTDSASLWVASASSVSTGALNVSSTTTLSWNVTAESDLSVAWDITTVWLAATSWTITSLTSDSATITTASVTDWLTVVGWIASDTLETSWAVWIGWNLAVTWDITVDWASTLTGLVTVGNITSTWVANLNDAIVAWNETVAWTMAVTWATTLNNTLTVAGASTLSGNASVGWNLSVAWNSTVTGNQTVTGDAIFSDDVTVGKDLVVSGDATFADEITVWGISHLDDVHATWDATIDGTLNVGWAINGGNWMSITWQIESDTIRTWEIVTDELRVNDALYLTSWGIAPDFVLQSEKGQPNGVAPLNVNGLIDTQYLPPVYTTAVVKMWTGVFSNSDTSVVVDADITSNSFVVLSNYQDIVWDLNETISVWQITVVSNHIETWSYKYIIVNSLS